MNAHCFALYTFLHQIAYLNLKISPRIRPADTVTSILILVEGYTTNQRCVQNYSPERTLTPVVNI